MPTNFVGSGIRDCVLSLRSVRLEEMRTRNGSCVARIAKSRAGSRGSRRRHGEEEGSPTRPLAVGRTVASAATFMNRLLDRVRRDALALAQRVGVLRRAG